MTKNYNIALLYGGNSNEREVSLNSAPFVEGCLTAKGHRVTKLDTAEAGFLEKLKALQPDVAFLDVHGKGGEDGTLQALLEFMHIPYTGSGVLASALAMDKYRSKLLYRALGLNTPYSLYLTQKDYNSQAARAEDILQHVDLPVVVKPSDDGSSVQVSIVKKKEELDEAVRQAFGSGSSVLIESFIKGLEATIPVVGAAEPQVLATIEVVPKNTFFDYESKYTDGGSEHIIPARISKELTDKANRVALLAHGGLGCFGVSRSDVIIDDQENVWILETNTIPGMRDGGLLCDAAEHQGLGASGLFEQLTFWGIERGTRFQSVI